MVSTEQHARAQQTAHASTQNRNADRCSESAEKCVRGFARARFCPLPLARFRPQVWEEGERERREEEREREKEREEEREKERPLLARRRRRAT